MDYELSQVENMDLFFYYGEKGSDPDMETQSDIVAGILQAKRSLFYDRKDSTGVPDKQNYPNSFILGFMTRYDIVNWNAWRNTQVSDGTNGNPDRRVVMSQTSIEITQSGQELDLNVKYIPFGNMRKVSSLTIPIGA